MQQLTRAQWTDRMKRHEQRAREWIDPHLQRRSRGEKHPIWDFLFDYYSIRPSRVLRWHPGLDATLIDATDAPHTHWRDYTVKQDGTVCADVDSFLSHRGNAMDKVLTLLRASEDNRAQFDLSLIHI